VWRILLLVLLCLAPRSLWAHTALTAASPAAGARLGSSPRGLRLTFTEAIELGFSSLELTGPGGEVALGKLGLSPDSSNVLVASIGETLAPGSYTVHWRTASADGHPARGSYTFSVEAPAQAPAAAPSAEPTPPPAARPAPAEPAPAAFDAQSPLYWLVRALTFLALVGVIGAVSFRLLVLRPAWRDGEPALRALCRTVSDRTARLGLAFASILVVAAGLRLAAEDHAMQMGTAGVWPMLSSTVWGAGWLLQLLAALLACVGFQLAAADSQELRKKGWTVAVLAALLLAFTPALSGHAVSTPHLALLAVAADGAHVLGAGAWLGTLLLVLTAGIPAAMRVESARGGAVAALVRAFSPVALRSAGVVVLSGLLAAWLHLGSVAALWESPYGRTLALKLLVVAAMLGMGAYNSRYVLRRLGDDRGTSRLRRSAGFELALGIIVLLITALLVATAPPPTS
jgi:putative copper export protein/methionine-rich copper-binding protein CopC